MPSYAHLFASGDERGTALVAYLASLGRDSIEQRRQQIAAWKPVVRDVISSESAARLFRRLCVQCHGEAGRGNGKLVHHLSIPPPDWNLMPWRHVLPTDDVETVLSRIIKFGLPGLPMAGHEYLPDSEIVGLARYVQTLHKTSGSASSAAVQP
jgi:cytochrome c oxidase cbb3-type subunit 2